MNKLALTLVIIGAINWLLVGAFQFDVVAMIFGSPAALGSRIVYCLVGISGLWCIGLLAHLFREHDDEHEHDIPVENH
jgi:uncharacterized membrane protein YuzA (DUF378 family)